MDDTPIPDAVEPPLPAPTIPMAEPDLPRPRTRWAAIVWGLALGALAAAGLWVLLDADRRAGITDWMMTLTPLSMVSYGVLVVGAIALVGGIAGLARRLQAGIGRRSSVAL